MRADIFFARTTFALRTSCNRLFAILRIVRLLRIREHRHGRCEKQPPRCQNRPSNKFTCPTLIARNFEGSELSLILPGTPDSLRRMSQSRRVGAERTQIRDRLILSPAAIAADRRVTGQERRSDVGAPRWSARRSLVLILGVGLVFWGAIYLLLFA